MRFFLAMSVDTDSVDDMRFGYSAARHLQESIVRLQIQADIARHQENARWAVVGGALQAAKQPSSDWADRQCPVAQARQLAQSPGKFSCPLATFVAAGALKSIFE